ncbi:hypothetical protein [Enterococcus hirae]|uniref:hypothetical protein n=1 Tax=Enterococcus hirae TaxID=1354 RepID=UPI000B65861E|nr:hypothetical protein [Enterococcus hirae]MCV3110754.1 hypothetical protein [Enterococcus hirae]OWW62830.1 hypothetical protein F521_10135 [Enterococcus hirae 67-03-C5]
MEGYQSLLFSTSAINQKSSKQFCFELFSLVAPAYFPELDTSATTSFRLEHRLLLAVYLFFQVIFASQ